MTFSFTCPIPTPQTHCLTLQLLLKGGFPVYSLGLLQFESEINSAIKTSHMVVPIEKGES